MKRLHEELLELHPAHNPRHLEAFMLVGGFRISSLTHRELKREAKIAAQCALEDPELAETLAKSYGL